MTSTTGKGQPDSSWFSASAAKMEQLCHTCSARSESTFPGADPNNSGSGEPEQTDSKCAKINPFQMAKRFCGQTNNFNDNVNLI